MSLRYPPLRYQVCVSLMLTILLVASLIPFAQADSNATIDPFDPEQAEYNATIITLAPVYNCSLLSDTDLQFRFILRSWVTRGDCIRKFDGGKCYPILTGILDILHSVRQAEYSGAASVLSLLPTIGALFGPPTSEIWRLKSIVPFGGYLAMSLSFGGVLMPSHVEDYENTVSMRNTAIGSILSLRRQLPGSQKSGQTMDEKLQLLADKIRERIDQHHSVRLPRRTLFIGLFAMFVLLGMAQAAIGVVEQGSVINFWCSSRWWMHMWYFLVTATAFSEDIVQRPFIKTYELFVSSLPYDVETLGGQPITDLFSNNSPSENVAIALKQLKTLKPATLTVYGSRLRTRSRNTVMITVSVVGENTRDSILRLISKAFSVGAFVTGTTIFASATLLSLIMAVVVLTLTLAAGLLGRAIAGWIVGRVSRTEPMIHIISGDEQEAYQAITEVLCLKSNDGTPFQVEINGHIFINERRVASRTRWSRFKVAMLGVLAESYDVTKAHQGIETSPSGTMSLSALSPRQTNTSIGGVSMPFLTGNAEPPSPPMTRMDHGVAKSVPQQNIRRTSSDSIGYSGHQIPRKSVPSSNHEQ